jgi:hypothetical protein
MPTDFRPLTSIRNLLYRSRVCVLCGVHRSADLVSRDNLTAALRGHLLQGGALVLRLGLFGQHRRHLVLTIPFACGA